MYFCSMIWINMKKTFLLIIVVWFVSSSCKKEVEESYPELIGNWTTGYEERFCTLEIDENSNANYKEINTGDGGGELASTSGKARANSKKLTIAGIHTFKFKMLPQKIDTNIERINIAGPWETEPRLANWKMELDPPFYYLNCTKYYKADY